MERYSKELVAVEPFVLNSVEHYPRALETTVKSQQSELEKLRREVERERGCRVEAERCAEETKTELINAQSTYALRLAEQRASHAEELEKRVEERFSRSKEESRQHSRMADARASQLAEDLASNRALLESQQTRHDEELRKEREKHGTTTEESARELQALRRNFARNESERNNELRNLLTQRAHLHHRISLLACVLTLAVVYIFYNLSIKAKIEDCPTVLQDLRQSLSTLLDTHYISIPISHVAKLHEKVANAIVACGMLAADNSTNQL